MAKKQKNITIASFNYLYEVQAIPKNVRFAYLEMLSRQKGKDRQKRVLVLKTIYTFVDENTISLWNPEQICKTLDISMDMLYCYKSRLLKGLRELYFSWPAEEKKIEETYAVTEQKDNSKQMPKLAERRKIMEMKFAKARRMAELGMIREAKNLYLHLKKEGMNGLNLGISYKNLLESEICEFLVFYYYGRRKKSKVKFYNQELLGFYHSVTTLNQPLSYEEKALFELRQRYSEFYAVLLDWYERGCPKIDNNKIKAILEIAKKSKYRNYRYKAIHHLTVLAITGNDMESAKNYCLEGFYFAKEEGRIPVTYAFASILYFLKSKILLPNVRLNYDKIMEYYLRAKKTIPLNLWTIYLENSLSMIHYPEIINKAPELLAEQANTNIMLGDHSLAVYWKYIQSADNYNKQLISFFDINITGFLEMSEVPDRITDEIDNSCSNTLCYHKALSDLNLLSEVYKLQLTVSFFKNKEFDLNYCRHIINKIYRNLNKKNTDAGFELLVLAVKMLEYIEHPKIITNKFEHKFKKLIDRFKENFTTFNLIDYAIISSLARRLRCKEITAIVKNLYHWLEANHREILAPALREIEERASKVKLIDGSKQSAA